MFKEFEIGRLFDIKTGRDIIIGDTKDGNIPLVSHQNTNNGIKKRIKLIKNRTLFSYKNTISLADRGIFWATTQFEDFHIGTRVKALILKGETRSPETLKYLATSINCLQRKFEQYLENATNKLPTEKISLPIQTKNNKPVIDKEKKYNDDGYIPDWDYMDEYVKNIQSSFIKKVKLQNDKTIDDFYKACNISNAKIDKNEEKKLSKANFQLFDVSRFFNISKTNSYDTSNLIKGTDYDYITRTTLNRGINNCTSLLSKDSVNPAHVFSLELMNMTFFYREREWFAGQFIRCINPLHKEICEHWEYFEVVLNGISKKLRTILVRDVDSTFLNSKISLPIQTKNNKPVIDKEKKYNDDGYIPDWDYMDEYVVYIKKKIISSIKLEQSKTIEDISDILS